MDNGMTWSDRLQMRALRWLAKGPGAAWMVAGSLAVAGLGAAALQAPAGAKGQPSQTTVGSSGLVVSYPGCYADPDGDGHIFCDGSVQISRLPASFGYCFADEDGDGRVICEGQGR